MSESTPNDQPATSLPPTPAPAASAPPSPAPKPAPAAPQKTPDVTVAIAPAPGATFVDPERDAEARRATQPPADPPVTAGDVVETAAETVLDMARVMMRKQASRIGLDSMQTDQAMQLLKPLLAKVSERARDAGHQVDSYFGDAAAGQGLDPSDPFADAADRMDRLADQFKQLAADRQLRAELERVQAQQAVILAFKTIGLVAMAV